MTRDDPRAPHASGALDRLPKVLLQRRHPRLQREDLRVDRRQLAPQRLPQVRRRRCWLASPVIERLHQRRRRANHLTPQHRALVEIRLRRSRDAAEMQHRCSRGAAEVQPRSRRGARRHLAWEVTSRSPARAFSSTVRRSCRCCAWSLIGRVVIASSSSSTHSLRTTCERDYPRFHLAGHLGALGHSKVGCLRVAQLAISSNLGS